MPEPYLPEDEAALYVMGELNADERREFKARLAESAELRSLVREIEEGTAALALASPPKQPPAKIWTRIEKAVAGESKRALIRPDFRGSSWGNGWAAAAACLVGWLLYALWVNHPAAKLSTQTAAADVHSEMSSTQTDAAPTIVQEVKLPAPTEMDAMRALLQTKMRDEAALRAQVVDLGNRVTRMAQSLTQQQALLNETSRLKFVQLMPVSGDGTFATNVNLSPELQRALALAVARELGWSQPGNANFTVDSNNITGSPSPTNFASVDFVDLRPGPNSVASPSSLPNQQSVQAAENTTPPAATPNSGIPAFISGSNLVMAIDATIAAKNSQLTFSAGAFGQEQQTLGSTTMGDNPTIVTIPLGFGAGDSAGFLNSSAYYSAVAPGFWGLSVSAGTAYGTSNIFQYYIGATNAP